MNKMSLMFNSEDLIEANRSNNFTEKRINNRMVRIPPVMFIKVTERLRKQILSNSWRLANMKDDIDGFGYYVKQSMPEPYRAVHAKYQMDFNRIKDENWDVPEGEPHSDCRFIKDRFYIDGKVQKEDISPPTPAEMFFMTDDVCRKIAMLDLKTSVPKEENRSRFTGFCATVTTLDDVCTAYMKVKKMEQRADRIMLAYRIKHEDTLTEGSVSNGEHFGDLEVMKVLKFQERVNVVLLVARIYGGVHLGKMRFRLIKEVAEEALTQVPGEIFCLPKPQCSETRRGRPRGCGRGSRGRGSGDGQFRGGFRNRYFQGGGRGRGQHPDYSEY